MAKLDILLLSLVVFAVSAVSSSPLGEVPDERAPAITLKESRTAQYAATFDNAYRVMMNAAAPVNNTIKRSFNRFFVYGTDSSVVEFVNNFPFFAEMLSCIGNILEKLLVVFNNSVKTGIKGFSHGVTLVRMGKYCFDQYPIREFPSITSCFVDMVAISLQEIKESLSKISLGFTKIMNVAKRWSYVFRHCGNKSGSYAANQAQINYSPNPANDPSAIFLE